MKFTPRSKYIQLLTNLIPKPPTDKELEEAVDEFYRVLFELNKSYYPIEITRDEFGTTQGLIKHTYNRPIETEDYPPHLQEHYPPYEKIEIEILLNFTPSGKILVAYKKDKASHYLYKIKKGEDICFLMEDSLDESTCLRNYIVFQKAREIAEKIKDILAPNSVKFIKED